MNAAREKVDAEGRCRLCGNRWNLEAAHLIARATAKAAKGYDTPDNIIPLCRECHRAFDTRVMDVLHVLTLEEQAHAVSIVGLEQARRRLAPTVYERERAA